MQMRYSISNLRLFLTLAMYTCFQLTQIAYSQPIESQELRDTLIQGNTLHAAGKLVKGLEDGFYQFRDHQGKQIMSGHYTNGTKSGFWSYYRKGILFETGWYLAGFETIETNKRNREVIIPLHLKSIDTTFEKISTDLDFDSFGATSTYDSTWEPLPHFIEHKDSIWTYYDSEGDTLYQLLYRDGSIFHAIAGKDSIYSDWDGYLKEGELENWLQNK